MKKVVLFAVIGIFAKLNAQAATVAYVSQTTDASGTQAPGTEYEFFGGAGQPTSLAGDFTVTPLGNVTYGGSSGYSTVIPPGSSTPFTTGIEFNSAVGTATLATFKVATPSITSFDVWVLTGNTDLNSINDSGIELIDGAANASVTFTDVAKQNVWTEFAVTGATTSDTFSLEIDPSALPYIGGLTFSAIVPVPEPSGSQAFSAVFLAAISGVSLLSQYRQGKKSPAVG
jgi:hypothetical protein